MGDLDFALGSLDADCRGGSGVAVGGGADEDGGCGYADGLVVGELADDAGVFVGAGAIFVDGGENAGSFFGGGRLDVVERLEDPG